MRMLRSKGAGGFCLAGGSHGDGVWRPTKYPATGATHMAVLHLTAAEASALPGCEVHAGSVHIFVRISFLL